MLRELERIKKKCQTKDEMHAYVGSKDKSIWSVVVELKDGAINKFLFVGDRSLGTFLKDLGAIA